MLPLIPLLLWSASSSLPARRMPALDSPTRHVRGTNPYVRRLLHEGYRRSPTLASLIDHLEASDVFVYIEPVRTLDEPVAAYLTLVPSPGTSRYLRIEIVEGRPPDELMVVLGHELRHAAEVADAPGVADTAGMERLYRRIGVRWGRHKYETEDALETERHVRKELAGS